MLEQAQTEDGFTSEEVLNLKWNLCSAFREEELYWKQKSRVLWLKEGYRNTKFFHAVTKQRRGRNHIIKLRNSAGGWVEDDEGINQVATTYFQNLFTTSSPGDPEDVLRYITAQVSPDINTSLTRPVLDSEIMKAIEDINPEKNAWARRDDWYILSSVWGHSHRRIDSYSQGFLQLGIL